MKTGKKFEKIKEMGFGKRQLILSCLILLIAVAGYINLNYTGIPEETETIAKEETSVEAQPEAVSTAAKPKADEVSEMKLERDKTQSESMAVFREIIDNDKTSKEARDSAQSDMAKSAKSAETEKMLESLLSAKGFSDTVCYINGEKINILVKTEGLTPSQAAQIKDAVTENADFLPDNIKIVEKN